MHILLNYFILDIKYISESITLVLMNRQMGVHESVSLSVLLSCANMQTACLHTK